MAELLPCPFCGCTTIKRQNQGDEFYWYECDWCQASGPLEPATEEYPETWNTRAQPAPDLTANAALAAQLAEACARADRAETQVTAISEELEAAYREIEAMRKGGA